MTSPTREMSDEVSVPRSTYLLMWVGLMLPFVLVACTADADVRPVLMSPSLDDVFATTEIQLEEDPKDPIGQVGVFDEVKDGGFVLGDRILPRVRIYGPQGQLRGSVGKRGEGPFEFLVIRGVAQGPSGEILVVDPRLGRISTFLVSLQRDTTVRPTPRPRGPIAHIGSETILETAPGSRMTQLTAMTSDWRERWSVTPPSLDQVLKNPYWTSAFSMPFAASSSHLIVANSLSYPIYV